MKERIKDICKQLEKKHNIEILFCVESGSRAWHMESDNSDYDVRFVFKRPIKDYIQINKPGDVIDAAYDIEGNKCAKEGCMIDVVGFDIFKFTKMLSDSNPNTLQWVQSEILYYGEIPKTFHLFAHNSFKKISLYYHNKSMCRNNYLKYLKSGSLVTYKKYLYAMRGLINAKWVTMNDTLPPINFGAALDAIQEIPEEIIDKLKEIVRLKKDSKEKDIIQNIVRMDNYIESFLKNDDEAPKNKQLATHNELKAELRKIILGED